MFSKQALTIILIILAAAFISGCASPKSQLQSKAIRSVADQIASYTVPEGYTEQAGIDMLSYQVVSLEGPTASCHIYLIQAPADSGIDIESLRKQISIQQSSGKREMQIVETRPVTLRGQSASVVIADGVNGEDQAYRQATALFEGRGGPALVSISTPSERWDDALVDTFLASLQ